MIMMMMKKTKSWILIEDNDMSDWFSRNYNGNKEIHEMYSQIDEHIRLRES